MSSETGWWRRWLWPLRSRKVQVAIATVLVAYAAQAGLTVSEETIVAVLSVGVALILGIAHEDAGRALGSRARDQTGPPSRFAENLGSEK